MVKKTLLTLALVAALVPFVSRSAAAQNSAQRPIASIGENVLLPAQAPVMRVDFPTHPPTAPSYCNPCLWYGGDFNGNNANADAFANSNSVLVPDTTVFVAFRVPAGQRWTITSMFSNNLSTDTGTIDPAEATWSVSKGLSSGNAGTTIASGTASATSTATGRSGFGLPEYTILTGSLGPVTLGQGQYWMSVVPQCTNSGDNNCFTQFFLSNTEGTNSVGPQEPLEAGFFNSSFFGFTYAPLCTVSSLGCNASSAGLLGTKMKK